MALYKRYKQQNNFDGKQKRSKPTEDTTISNMMGYGGNGSVNMDHKDYGKVKSKGGLTKASTINNAKSKKK